MGAARFVGWEQAGEKAGKTAVKALELPFAFKEAMTETCGKA